MNRIEEKSKELESEASSKLSKGADAIVYCNASFLAEK
jgi:hypothetical protein